VKSRQERIERSSFRIGESSGKRFQCNAGKVRETSCSPDLSSAAMANSKNPRKRKLPVREKTVTVSFARKLIEDLERVDHAITMARLYAGDKDDFRDGIEALVKVVDQQGKVLRDLLLALEEHSR
jgi:hypothetical protein